MHYRYRGMLLALAVFLSSSCLDFDSSFDEVARVTSPTSKFDAVLAETNGGATTSFGYEVFLVPKGEKIARGKGVASFYGAVRSEHAYGVNLKWESSHSLVIEYLEARGATLSQQKITINDEVVSVAMRSGVSDPSAPPGGMLYNLEKNQRR